MVREGGFFGWKDLPFTHAELVLLILFSNN